MRNSLRALEGVSHVEVDLDEKLATVVYAVATVDSSTMIEATTNIGFPSSVMMAGSNL